MGKKTAQQRQKKRKEIKVVYISNPVKFKTTASDFRALVQVLTGRDAADPIESATKFFAANAAEPQPPSPPASDDLDSDQTYATQKQDEDSEPENVSLPGGDLSRASHLFDDDDVFGPQMMEPLNGIFPYSLLYESPVEMLLSLDAV